MKQIFFGEINEGDVLRFRIGTQRSFDVMIVDWIGQKVEDLLKYSFDIQDFIGIFRKDA